MDYIKGLESNLGFSKTAITLGKFDGLHRGHQKLVREVSRLKEEYGVLSVVFAFDMCPLFERLKISKEGIMTNEERRQYLEGKVDVLVECPFTEEISKIEAETFIKDILVGLFRAKYVVVGTDFHFGHGKRGDVQMLSEYADLYGYELRVIEKELYGEHEISSTYIRKQLKNGNMEMVNPMLGYPYTIIGQVEYGKQLGRKLGFPTINVYPAKGKILPPKGVYLVCVEIDGIWYNGIGNVGVKPTVTSESRILIESYLFGYEGNAYGKEVKIQIHKFCRQERKFATLEELKKQVYADIAVGREYFA